MTATKLSVEKVQQLRRRLLSEHSEAVRQLEARCSHKHTDGTDATTPVPVSGERFCRACGAVFD